ncbi:hypothetical protein BKI52_21780 [marine bacterium AO1-C]|nr:hypothetical protein BKI52_21780 [marine bacterium AO1-C]
MNTKDTLEKDIQDMWGQFTSVSTIQLPANMLEQDAVFWKKYEAMIAHNKQVQLDHKKTVASLEHYTSFVIDTGKKHLLWQQIFRDNIRQMFTIWVVLALFSNLILIFSGVSAHLLLSEIIETLKIGNLLIFLPCLMLFFGRIQSKTSFLNTEIKISPEQISGISPMAKPGCVYYDELVDIKKHALGLCLISKDESNIYYGNHEAVIIPYALKDFDKALQQIYFYWENNKVKYCKSLSD